MTEPRAHDWDWVDGRAKCSPLVMFGTIKTLAQQNVTKRNQQKGKEMYQLFEHDGITFAVNRTDGIGGGAEDRVQFKVSDDLKTIEVSVGRQGRPTVYSVGLDVNGGCALRSGSAEFQPWQLLRTHLEALLFLGE